MTALLRERKFLVFMDKCHFYQHGTRIRTWYPAEDADLAVLQEPNRKRISVFGAVSIKDSRLVTEIMEKYNAPIFLEFPSLV
ncbi:MAG: hypothetical protein B2I17_02080 [Thermoplasmatales archaeon B_DKE]|nr:MAG: hypothetical protein B2I17_02080 [Thermoplasmatales archaeon B_DKE]